MVAQIVGIKSFYYQVERGKGKREIGKTLFMTLPFMGICWFHTVELDFPNHPNYEYLLYPTSTLRKKGSHRWKKTVISQLPLWRKHVYLWTVYIQFCCPKFNMTRGMFFLCCPWFPAFPVWHLSHSTLWTFIFPRYYVSNAFPEFLCCLCMPCCGVSLYLSSTLIYIQLLPDLWHFNQTHLCTNSGSSLCSVYALKLPKAPAVQQIKNLASHI